MRNINSFIPILNRNSKNLLLIIIVLVTLIWVGKVTSQTLTGYFDFSLSTVGTIKTVGVEAYWDSKLQNKVEIIDWGTIYIGTTKNVTLYIRNLSNVKTTVECKTSSLIPAELSNYIKIFWNHEKMNLNPNEVIQVNLFLEISESPSFLKYLIEKKIENFNFDIFIVVLE